MLIKHVPSQSETSKSIDYTWVGGFAGDIVRECAKGSGFVNGQESDSQDYVVLVCSHTC